jgi:hypothetical protein
VLEVLEASIATLDLFEEVEALGGAVAAAVSS